MRKNLAFALAATVLLFLASNGQAGKFNKVVSVGDAAPKWSGVVGVNDKQHSLADYKDAKLIVQVFTCNHCPVAMIYEDRLVQLQKDYKDKGVQFVAVCVSHEEADSLPAMKQRAESKGFNFPYLHDPSQKSGRDFGAVKTPQVFVLDGKRKIAYMGGIDDSWRDAAEVKRSYLRDALDALLDGKTPEVTETRPDGCGIVYE